MRSLRFFYNEPMQASSHPSWIVLHSNILLTTLLSAVIHIASTYSYWLYHLNHANASDKPIEQPVKISFTTVAVASHTTPSKPTETVKETPEPVAAPEPFIEEIAKSQPQTEVTKSSYEKPRVVKKAIKPELVKNKNKPLSKTRPQAPESKFAQAEKLQQHTPAPLPVLVVEDTPSILEIEEQYITLLLNRIENNKFYPRQARRRNIEGKVKVVLSISSDGNITSLSLTEGHTLLRTAAEKAVRSSQPLPNPPPSLVSPETVSFEISYRFRDK